MGWSQKKQEQNAFWRQLHNSLEFGYSNQNISATNALPAGLRYDKVHFNFKWRLYWARFLALETQLNWVQRTAANSLDLEFLYPLRISWARDQFIAPVIGWRVYSSGDAPSAGAARWLKKASLLPVGAQVHFDIWGLGFWAQYLFSLKSDFVVNGAAAGAGSSQVQSMRLQVDLPILTTTATRLLLALAYQQDIFSWKEATDRYHQSHRQFSLLALVRF